MGVLAYVVSPRWHLPPSWLPPLVPMNSSPLSCYGQTCRSLQPRSVQTPQSTRPFQSGRQDMTQSDQTVLRPGSSEREIWQASGPGKDILWMNAEDSYTRARLLATSAPHSGDWLLAIPISSCGLRLDDEAIRIAVGLRLGCKIGEPHDCVCGELVDARGSHSVFYLVSMLWGGGGGGTHVCGSFFEGGGGSRWSFVSSRGVVGAFSWEISRGGVDKVFSAHYHGRVFLGGGEFRVFLGEFIFSGGGELHRCK